MSQTINQQPIRILHRSDIHFQAETDWDRAPVLRQLVGFIAREVEQGLAPDLVAISGDLAFSGKPAEYAHARQWLGQELWPVLSPDRSQALPRDRLLLVPGNHDSDRDSVDEIAQAVQAALLRDQDQERIAKILGDPTQRKVLLRRHAAYLAFYAKWLDSQARGAKALPWRQ